jgi:hypothetical protein
MFINGLFVRRSIVAEHLPSNKTRKVSSLTQIGNDALKAGDWPAAREAFQAALAQSERAEAIYGGACSTSASTTPGKTPRAATR